MKIGEDNFPSIRKSRFVDEKGLRKERLKSTVQSTCSKNERMTSALAPAFSPRRGRIVRRSLENLYDWIDQTFIRKTRNNRKQFPLLGERIEGEGGRKHSFH
jgi:hypothetical protein